MLERSVLFERSSTDFMPHACNRCNSPATIHLTEIKGGKKTERHFCEECARVLHVPQPSKEIQKLLASFEPAHALSQRQAASLQKSCPECGMTYGEFRQQGRFGCAHDYEVFGEEVVALLERIHGSSSYAGKLPGGKGEVAGDVRAEIMATRKQLQQAIDSEDYELAARLRDEIRRLTNAPSEET